MIKLYFLFVIEGLKLAHQHLSKCVEVFLASKVPASSHLQLLEF